ncbi:hypothetical protein SteCoe_27500 [Stentor coeruleus]|uniref:RGS domain-containing protein n=1 Tax=Stentor coeruleus TaxID=5963 RepID=A0A1R2BAP8_9CILI|nr:hypothetical protein SteCoe_27500 [Stentor coeruleus]
MGSVYYILSIVIVISFITLVTFSCIFYIFYLDKNSGHIGLYERSQFLFILGAISNYLSSIFNIVNGIIIENIGCKEFNKYSYLLVPTFTLSRLYAVSMILRIYRQGLLNLLRSGEVSKEYLFKRLSLCRTACLISCYLFLTLTLFTIANVLIDYSTCDSIFWPFFASYSIETFLFFYMSWEAYKVNIHPTIVIEYLFYALSWGTSSFTPTIDERWVLQIPLRNCVLLVLAAYSMHEHYKLIRPPLPLEISLRHVFSIEELYYDFKYFLMKLNNEDYIEWCEVYCELTRADFVKYFKPFKDRYSQSIGLDSVIQRDIDESNYDELKIRLEDRLQNPVHIYFNSEQFLMFKKLYYVNFN